MTGRDELFDTNSFPESISSTVSVLPGSITYQPERRKVIWEASWLQDSRRRTGLTEEPCSTSIHSSSSHTWPLASFLPSTPESLVSTIERFGSPCHIKWLSAQTLLFDEIRGLRNAWNDNKAIHIARNITAIEPTVAATLLERWKEKEGYIQAEHGRRSSPQALRRLSVSAGLVSTTEW